MTRSPPDPTSNASSPRIALIEGTFTHQALPALFRFLAARSDSLLWELTSLAGTFRLTFQQGVPVDIMFTPVRPIGATIGLKALKTLFLQAGGGFRVFRDPPDPGRRSLHASSERLLIEMATLEDESTHHRTEVRIDVSAELALVHDLPDQTHRTAFRTSTRDVPWVEVLQLFALSGGTYSVALLERDGTVAGRLQLARSGMVEQAEYGGLRGTDAFSALVTHRRRGVIEVRDQQVVASPDPVGSGGQVGLLDGLLMAEFLAGRLSSDPSPPTEVGLTAPGNSPDGHSSGRVLTEPQPPPSTSVAPSLKTRLGTLFRRRA